MFGRQLKDPLVRTVAAGALSLSALGLAGCTLGGESDETSAPAVQQGVEEEAVTEQDPVDTDVDREDATLTYDLEFYDNLENHVDGRATALGDVERIISPNAFVLAGTDEAVNPMLVVSAEEVTGLQEGGTVEVTGTVREPFDLTAAEETLAVDLPQELAEHAEEPSIVAERVDTTVPEDN